MDEENERVRIPHLPQLSSEFVVDCLVDFVMSGDCCADAIPLVYQAAGRIHVQKTLINFLSAGLLVTNGLWVAYHYGILG